MLAALLAVALGVAPPAAREAKELTRRSLVEYDTGDFDRSLADATRAYELDPLPAFLFNIAQCHRALHHWEQAEFFYHRYLGHVPRAKNRKMVEGLITAVQIRQGKTPEASAPQLPELTAEPLVPADAPPAARKVEAEQVTAKADPGLIRDVDVYPVVVVRDDEPHMPATRKWAWTLGGLALGFAAGAVGFGVASSSASSSIQGTSRPVQPSGAAALATDVQNMKTFGLAADVLYGVAAASAVASVTLFLVHPHENTSVSVGLAPAGTGLGLSGSF